jgi:crossover junction endodeoxyribonuclease RuvC
VITPPEQADLSFRLLFLFEKTAAVVAQFRPDEAAIEESFVNTNASSTLKLGHARAAIMLAPAQAGLGVAEYAARYVKKSVVGTGAAEKAQVQFMIRRLLPSVGSVSTDEADALAVAIAHAHSRAKKPTVRELRVESAFGGNQ